MTQTSATQIRLERRSPSYWRVTFDIPPLNIFGPKNIPQLNEIIARLETDEHVKVVVFDSAVEGFFLTHYDFLAKPEDQPSYASWPDGSAAASRHAGTAEPRSSCVHCLNSRTRYRRRERARAGKRYAFCESGKSHLVAMGGWCWLGSRRRPDGTPAPPHRPRTCVRSAARSRRYSRRSRRALWLC